MKNDGSINISDGILFWGLCIKYLGGKGLAREVAIKCKTCGNTLGTFKFEGKLTFDYKCKKCKQKNVGVITEKKARKSAE